MQAKRPKNMRPQIDESLQQYVRDCAVDNGVLVGRIVNEAVYRYLAKYGREDAQKALRLPPKGARR